MPNSQLTILNFMASTDFDESVALHREWGLKWIDLKEQIYGHTLKTLDEPSARRAKAAADAADIPIFCLSTSIFFEDIRVGETAFQDVHLTELRRTLQLAEILQPSVIRIIGAQLPRDKEVNAIDVLKADYPWIVDVYREAIDIIHDAGYISTIENEGEDCILSLTEEFVQFVQWIDRPGVAHLTWDVQNQWQNGVFPTAEVYAQLKPYLVYVHLKGGASGDNPRVLQWRTSLEDASWPVAAITQTIVDDDTSPIICLNPSHGAIKPGYDYTNIVRRDIDFLRRSVKGIE